MRSVCGCTPARSAATLITYTARSSYPLGARRPRSGPWPPLPTVLMTSAPRRPQVLSRRLRLGLGELLQQRLRLLREFLGDHHADRHKHVARLVAQAAVEPATLAPDLTSDAEGFPRLRPRRDLERDRPPVERGDRDLGTQGRLGVGDREREGEVLALAAEDRVRDHRHRHVEVARLPLVGRGVALAGDPDAGPVADTGRDADLDRALRARPGVGQVEAGRRALERLSERQGDLGLCVPPLGRTPASTVEDRPEDLVGEDVPAAARRPGGTGEDVAQVAQVLEADPPAAGPSPTGATGATEPAEARTEHLPKVVVLLAGLGVAQHVVGVGDLLELLLGRRVAGVGVRVVLLRQLAVGLLDVGLGRALLDAEGGVVVLVRPLALGHGS